MLTFLARIFILRASARVAELADALDLGSSELCSCGFESLLSHFFLRNQRT